MVLSNRKPPATGRGEQAVAGVEVGVGAGLGPAFTGVAARGSVVAAVVDPAVVHAVASAVRHGSDAVADAAFLERTATAVGGGAAAYSKPLRLGGPNGGRYWEVTAITVLGPDEITAVGSTNVVFYVGNPDSPSVNDVRLPGVQGGSAVTVPANAQFGPHTFVVMPGSQVYVRVYGAASSVQLVALMQGWDRPLWADNERSLQGRLGQRPDTLLGDTPPQRA